MAINDTFFQFSIPQKLKNWLPPDKRKSTMFAFLKALTNSINNLIIQWISDYKEGASVVERIYKSTTTYAIGDKAIYDETYYRCIKAATGIIPTNTEYWEYWSPSAFGVDERIRYNHLRATLEYALWKRGKAANVMAISYSTTPSTSSIYIVTNSNPNNSFIVGGAEDLSSDVTDGGSNGYVFTTVIATIAYSYTINIPLTVYNAYTLKQWTSFIDKYNTAGLLYNITTY